MYISKLRISFNTTTMTSLGFIAPPLKFSSPPNLIFLLRSPLLLFWSESFRCLPKICGGGAATMIDSNVINSSGRSSMYIRKSVVPRIWNLEKPQHYLDILMNTSYTKPLRRTKFQTLPKVLSSVTVQAVPGL